MTKPKKIGIVLLTAGAVLVIAALLLFSHNRAEDRRAGESAEETLRLVEAAMAERGTNGETGTTPAPGDSEPDAAATATNAPGASASPGAAAAGTETGSGGLPAPPALDMPTVRSGAYDYIGYLLIFRATISRCPSRQRGASPRWKFPPAATPAACTTIISS